ncbi:hypothetical protein CEXT_56701 [Caerostris extrusa]|uniref:Uncharacterized protein n=1 Tax=Caerostris extrusa TaxID=172846 RepID=A0AAV4TV15_CAEEX|nr:hypothetical protein CEXT_56701 [Caerostris extrusa]
MIALSHTRLRDNRRAEEKAACGPFHGAISFLMSLTKGNLANKIISRRSSDDGQAAGVAPLRPKPPVVRKAAPCNQDGTQS